MSMCAIGSRLGTCNVSTSRRGITHARCTSSSIRRPPRRAVTLCRAAGDGQDEQDPYEALFNSKVMKSDLVQADFNSIVGELMGLARMASQFPSFDLAGKRLFLEKMDEAGERYEVFIKRLELSQDPGAREYLRHTNAQMLEGGFTLPAMFSGLKQSLGEYRKWVDLEEKASVDPAAHQAFLKEFKVLWSRSALGGMDFGKLSNTDMSKLDAAQRDPMFWKAIKEIADNPSDPSIMAKWMDDPNIGPLVAEMARMQMQQQSEQ
ncbi:hypothetical protein FOA52_006605 [Chlamydomonas sp. UWO 241]|nr:hypothetical protein FOA52_006605 [Chlamydomonas sp. UWO 241]